MAKKQNNGTGSDTDTVSNPLGIVDGETDSAGNDATSGVDSDAVSPSAARNADADRKPKRRGRPSNAERAANGLPPYGGTKPEKKNSPALNPHVVQGILHNIHAMLAVALRNDVLMLDEKESALLANALCDVAKHYPVAIDPKIAAWSNLGVTAAMIYGPRLFVRRVKQRAAPDNVTPIHAGQGVPYPAV